MLNPKSKIQNPKSDDPGIEVDRELARRIGEGDREALASLLDRHLGAVYGYLARRLGPGYEGVAADLTRATFSDAFRRLKPYARGTASTPMRLWLIKLASEQGLGVRGEGLVSDLDPSPLREAMSQLPRRQQAVMSL